MAWIRAQDRHAPMSSAQRCADVRQAERLGSEVGCSPRPATSKPPRASPWAAKAAVATMSSTHQLVAPAAGNRWILSGLDTVPTVEEASGRKSRPAQTSKEFMDMATSNDTTPVQRKGAVPSPAGPADSFSGRVRIDGHHQAPELSSRQRGLRDVRAGRPHELPHPSPRTDARGHGRRRLDPMRGRASQGDSSWRRCLVPLPAPSLAWRHAYHGHDPQAITEALDGKAVEWMEPVTGSSPARRRTGRRPEASLPSTASAPSRCWPPLSSPFP